MDSIDDHAGEAELKCFSHGRVVQTSDGDLPYKAILTRGRGGERERSFATMREAEAFIRRNTPRPKGRSTAWDDRRA